MATWIVHFVPGGVKAANNPMNRLSYNAEPKDHGFVVDLGNGEKDVYP